MALLCRGTHCLYALSYLILDDRGCLPRGPSIGKRGRNRVHVVESGLILDALTTRILTVQVVKMECGGEAVKREGEGEVEARAGGCASYST